MDWWDGISGEEQSEIEEGLARADRDEVVPHNVIFTYKGKSIMGKTIEKELLSHILQLEQPQQEKVLQYIKLLLAEEEDFADGLSNEQLTSIKRGLQQVNEGKTVPHEEVRKRYQKWL